MQSKATTVREYLAELPADRRQAIEAVRKVVLANLDKDYVENMSYGMIGYCVPHRVYPAGYHCKPEQPLPFAALASQKGHMSLYLMSIYGDHDHAKWFVEAWQKTGKKLDMGKSCIRFKSVDELALDVIGQAIKRVPAKKYIALYETMLGGTSKGAKSAGARKEKTGAARSQPAKKKPAKRRAE